MAYELGTWIGGIIGGTLFGYLFSSFFDRVLVRRFVQDRSTAIGVSTALAYGLLVTLAALGGADGGPVTLVT